MRDAEVIGESFDILELDCATCSVADQTFASKFKTVVTVDSEFNAFGGWFDVDFNGSKVDPTPSPVTLTTCPESTTHWAQQVFMVHPPHQLEAGDELEGTVKVTRQKLNHRLLWVQVTFCILRDQVGQVGPERTLNYRID